jgi:hypothetical protein
MRPPVSVRANTSREAEKDSRLKSVTWLWPTATRSPTEEESAPPSKRLSTSPLGPPMCELEREAAGSSQAGEWAQGSSAFAPLGRAAKPEEEGGREVCGRG